MENIRQMKSWLAFWRTYLGATIIICIVGLWRLNLVSQGYISLLHSNWTYFWAAPFGVVILLFMLLWSKYPQRWFSAPPKQVARPAGVLALICLLVFLVVPVLFTSVILYPGYMALSRRIGSVQLAVGLRIFSSAVGYISVRVLLFFGFLTLGMICAKIVWKRLPWSSVFILSLLANAGVYSLAVVFSAVNNYPFSLGWSEVSRYYGASLFFAQRLYGQLEPLPALHPTWHLLLTVPYFFGNLPIWIHRFWQALLQFALTFATGIVLTLRLGLRKRLVFWGVVIWAFLFLSQEQVLFSLLVSVIIIFGWVNPHKFWYATLLVLLASIWAGLSRINWFPVPGILAAVLYFLEISYGDSKSWAHYLWKPATWFFVGTAVAFGVNSLYNSWSGNFIKGGQFASSLTSDLLWNRLLPNSTYPMGILLAAFLASAPLVLIIVLALRRHGETIHPLRLAGIFTAMTVLLLGGLVVSVKIGGGADLHNLDAFFVLLMLVGSYFYLRRWAPETSEALSALTFHPVVLIFAVVIPVWFILQSGGPLFEWDQTTAIQAVNGIRVQTEQVTQKHGEVLFISQRQLLALQMVAVPLVPEYEQDYLMEMVMSHNHAYLNRFQADLQAHRFGMIVSDSYTGSIQKSDLAWAAENNLWVQEVVRPLNCYYDVAEEFKDQGIVLYVPRANPCE